MFRHFSIIKNVNICFEVFLRDINISFARGYLQFCSFAVLVVAIILEDHFRGMFL